ncbi:tail fiber protein [Salmonella phage SE20]|uniref:Tail fiber protein n=1 Tax=Salmonella phage SE20 TaxID=2592199 RepID=A0A5C0CGH4_9CAUD|nr:tail fiber protein [Salmonella phage SE20]
MLLLDALAAIQVLSARVSKLESLLEDKPTTLPEDPAPNQDLP